MLMYFYLIFCLNVRIHRSMISDEDIFSHHFFLPFFNFWFVEGFSVHPNYPLATFHYFEVKMFPTYRLPLLDVEVGLHIIAVVGLTLLVLLNSLLRGKKDKDAPPTVALSFPVIGNYIEFAKGPMDLMYKCQEKYGNIFTVPMLHKRLTFVLGPEVSAPFFASDDTKMSQPEVYGFMTPVFGKGVVYDAEPDKRMKQYQGMAHGLGQRAFKAYVPKIEKETVDFFKKHWTSNQRTTAEVNILDALSELTILTASRCLHGDDAREELFEDIARVYHDLDKGVTPLSFFFPYAPTAAHKLRDNVSTLPTTIMTPIIIILLYENSYIFISAMCGYKHINI